LGIFDFGKYATADPTKDYAFIKIREMWDKPVQDSTEDEDKEETDNERTPNENNNDTNDETLQIAQTDKHTTKRKRKQQDTHTDQQPITRPKTQHQEINIRETRKLHEDIKASEDKLFIIKKTEPNEETKNWHLVQIDWEETNHSRARRLGEYHTKFYVRNATDAKKRLVCKCRYWPLIYEIRHDGYFGRMIPVRPNKVEEVLKNKPTTRGWYQMDINIAEDRLIGPFNFTTQQDGTTMETHRIREEIWKALETEVREEETMVDISDVRTRQPFT
jgi:hypothetical protein